MRRYSQVRALGVADEHEHELVAERGEHEVERRRTRRRCTWPPAGRARPASRAPMSMTPATWAATASALKSGSASAATTKPSREMSRAATMPGRLPVGASWAARVSAWSVRCLQGGVELACARRRRRPRRPPRRRRRGVRPSGEPASSLRKMLVRGIGGAVGVGQGAVERQLDERVAAQEEPAGLTPREPHLDAGRRRPPATCWLVMSISTAED